MKIKNITIRNFRSIRAANIDCSEFNIFVGQNNAGKTNLFEALEWFFNGPSKGQDINQLRYRQNEQHPMSVAVTFSGAQEGAQKMKHEGNRTKIVNALEEADEVTLIRACKDPKNRKILIGGEEKKPGTGFDKTLNDFLPKFEYIHTKQYYDAVAKFNNKTPVGVMLSEVLDTILEENEQYQSFQEKFRELFANEDSAIKQEFDRLGRVVQNHLSRQFPDCVEVAFQVAAPTFSDLLKNFETTLDDGVLTTAGEKGDGMQRALMLAIIQAYAEYRREKSEATKSFLFFIDEAELHLHPMAQRNLKEVLLELSGGADQVFINTHSSVFVTDEHPEQQILKVEKRDGKSMIEKVDEYHKPYVVFELLGGNPADLLLPRNFLIVEGPSEVELIQKVVRRFYTDQPHIQIIPAHGDLSQTEKSINAIEKAFRPLNRSIYHKTTIVLCDQPDPAKSGATKSFHQRFPHLKHGQYMELDTGSLEAYYPIPWKACQKVAADKKVKLARRVGIEITREQFETEMPIIFQALQACLDRAY